jgi:hypothetical protein
MTQKHLTPFENNDLLTSFTKSEYKNRCQQAL